MKINPNILMVAALGFITSCASVNTNVSDYYLKNAVESLKPGESTQANTKLYLYRLLKLIMPNLN